jgi:two-component system response regulator MprA
VGRVLVVDDDPSIREVLISALEDEGYEVRAAPDGAVALELLESWRPDVILLDLMMPNVDGWTFRTRQLAAGMADQVPVIVLSAGYNLQRPSVEGLRATAVMAKPFDLDALLGFVGGLLR